MPWKLEIWLPKQFIPLSTQMPLARGFRKFKSPENGLHPCQSPFQLPAIQKKAWLPCRLWGASTGGLGGPPLVSLACGRPFLPTSSSSRSRARPASRYRASRHRGANFSLCGRGGRKPPSGCFSPQTRSELLASSARGVFGADRGLFSRKSAPGGYTAREWHRLWHRLWRRQAGRRGSGGPAARAERAAGLLGAPAPPRRPNRAPRVALTGEAVLDLVPQIPR